MGLFEVFNVEDEIETSEKSKQANSKEEVMLHLLELSKEINSIREKLRNLDPQRKLSSSSEEEKVKTIYRIIKEIEGKDISNNGEGKKTVLENDFIKNVNVPQVMQNVENRALIGAHSSLQIKVPEKEFTKLPTHENPVVYRDPEINNGISLVNTDNSLPNPQINVKKEIAPEILPSSAMKIFEKPIITDFDKILQLTESNGAISFSEIEKKLSIPREKIEDWVKVLESRGLINLTYPIVGEPVLKKKISSNSKLNL